MHAGREQLKFDVRFYTITLASSVSGMVIIVRRWVIVNKRNAKRIIFMASIGSARYVIVDL